MLCCYFKTYMFFWCYKSHTVALSLRWDGQNTLHFFHQVIPLYVITLWPGQGINPSPNFLWSGIPYFYSWTISHVLHTSTTELLKLCGPVVESLVKTNPGFFSLEEMMKRWKLLLIQTRCLKKYFWIHKQTIGQIWFVF